MDDTDKLQGQGQAGQRQQRQQQQQRQPGQQPEGAVIHIGNDPVMQSAVEVLSALSTADGVMLRAKGHSIPNAVAVANIVTERMPAGSKIPRIYLDTESAAGIGRMTSTIEILLHK